MAFIDIASFSFEVWVSTTNILRATFSQSDQPDLAVENESTGRNGLRSATACIRGMMVLPAFATAAACTILACNLPQLPGIGCPQSHRTFRQPV